jgi:addiction module HigA family antidote
MDINEARRRLAENPPQGDPTEIAVGESLAEKAARLELEGLQRAMAAPLPGAEELAAGRAADRAMAERIHRARPGVPLHHVFAVLESLRTVRRLDAAKEGEPGTVEPMGKDLAALLTASLAAAGMSQADLARQAGLTTKHVSRLANGKAAISFDMAFRLEAALGVDAAEWTRAEIARLRRAVAEHAGRTGQPAVEAVEG